MTAWVFGEASRFYACRYGSRELPDYREACQLDECPGMWFGPVEVPD